MKIQELSTQAVSVPTDFDLGRKYGPVKSIHYLLVELRSSEGHTGLGYAYSLLPDDIYILRSVIRFLSECVVGQDPLCIEQIWQKMYRQNLRLVSNTPAALAAIDIALWDLQGKILEQPVYRLLGGFRDSIPAYASYNLWESVPPDDLARNAEAFVSQGFKALKIRTGGSTSPQREAERFGAVRSAVGPDIKIMYDAIQYYTTSEAINIGRALERYNPYWFEDPVPEEDLDGCAKVAAALDVPVVCGETMRFPAGHHLMLEKRATDIVMVDMARVGGITPWRKVAAESESRNLSVVSHVFTEISAHVLAAIPNSLYLEYIPWSFPLFAEPPLVKDGICHLSDKPGHGFTLSPETVKWQFSSI